MTIDEHDASEYNRRLGERIRSIRKQKRLSLHQVEASSGHLFKASVLGAYERGERALSVPRLERLARFYALPLEQLLPREFLDGDPVAAGAPETDRLVLDVVRLEQLDGVAFDGLRAFVRSIQVKRNDVNGRVITVREADVPAIAAMLDVPVEEVGLRLQTLELLFC